MARPTFNPEFEEQESTIKDRMLERIPDDWRKEEGDFIHDAVAPTPLEIKQLQVQQDNILQHAFPQYAEGNYLDLKVAEAGLTRMAPVANQRKLSIAADNGVVIPAGHTASVVILDTDGNPIEYTVDEAVEFTATGQTLEVAITCTYAGKVNVPDGSEFILLPPIPGVRSITDQGSTIPGANPETDEALFTRYLFKRQNPDTGGNKNDYIRWAVEVDGVSLAKTIPRWNGNGTVKVLVVDSSYEPATSTLLAEVQEYLDPNQEGLGEGKAPCGARVTAAAPADLPIDITATVVYDTNADQTTAQEAFKDKVREYLKELVFTGNAVAYAKIGAFLVTTDGILNYSDLTLNGVAADVAVGAEEVATLGTVTI